MTLRPPSFAALSAAFTLRRAELRQTVRVTIGCVLAFVLYHLLNLPQGYWAVFTVVIVMQGSIGGTLSASIDRMKGTLLGALVGGIAAWLRPQTPTGLGVSMALSVMVTVFAATMRPTLKVAPVTAVIMLISPSSGAMGPLVSALYRVVEIFIGSVIGVATSVLIFPARSNSVVIERVDAVLDQLALLAEHYAEDVALGAHWPERHLENASIRAGLGQVDAAMTDAARERSSRLADHRIAEALPRTLWRVRNDCVAAGRAIIALPDQVRPLLAEEAAIMFRAEAGFMRACGQALASASIVDRAGRVEALQRFDRVIEAIRTSRVTQGLGLELAGPVFALAFSLDGLHRNLGDLADRVDETVLGRAETRPAT